MKLVMNTNLMFECWGDDVRAVRTIANAGFDAYDITLDAKGHYIYDDDYMQKTKCLKREADALGLPCLQAHSPALKIASMEDFNRDVALHSRSIEMCHELECSMLVVHPGKNYSAAENYANLYGKLLPMAERMGVRIATENMWNWNEDKTLTYPSACGSVEDFCAHIDIANSYYLTGCLDIGHAEMTGAPGAATMIRGLGKSRIGCLHVHDNDVVRDRHTLPYQGKINWEEVIAALRDIGYEEHFTFEAGNFIKHYPDELFMAGLVHMEQLGRYFIKRITE